MTDDNEPIAIEQIEMLDILFGNKRVWIETDEAYKDLGETFDENE